MVSRNLVAASENLNEIVTDVDIRAVATASAGIGTGLMAAEIAGGYATDFMSGQRPGVQTASDIGARGASAFGINAVRQAVDGGPLVDTLMMMASFGAASSAVLRVIEVGLDFASDQFTTNAPQSGRGRSRSRSRSKRSASAAKRRSSSSSSTRSNRATVSASDPQSVTKALLG